jgi:hypothetical protein
VVLKRHDDLEKFGYKSEFVRGCAGKYYLSGNEVSLLYDKGSVVVRGQYGVPNGVWDERIGAFRTRAYHYKEILNFLEQSRIRFEDHGRT